MKPRDFISSRFFIDHEFIVDKKCFIVYSKIVVNCVDLSKQVKSGTRSIIICGEENGICFHKLQFKKSKDG